MSVKKILFIVVGVVVLLLVVWWLKLSVPNYPDIQSPRPIAGNEQASLVLTEFSDFQCPACKAAQPLLKDLMATFGDRLRLEFKHYPLISIHTQAFRAALAVECANDQEQFWQYHDKLFDNQPNFSEEELINYAGELNLDKEKFSACLLSKAKTNEVRQDIKEGDGRQVNATPTFLLNGEPVVDWTKLKEIIQSKLIGG
ncbi:DsbA family protein [Patescibacteria group bacterium]|nr:DsbA family protein [Patescibacteria group bacterium]